MLRIPNNSYLSFKHIATNEETPRGKTNVVYEQVNTNPAVQSQKQARSLKFRI